MKANELMTGDWIYNRVANITFQVYPQFFSQWYNRPEQFEETIQPISLTAEILEKNGWKIISNTPNKLEYLWSTGATEEYADVRVLVGKDRNNVLRWDFPALNIHLYRGDIGLTKFKYVHELQHALRLCGIDKEIVL